MIREIRSQYWGGGRGASLPGLVGQNDENEFKRLFLTSKTVISWVSFNIAVIFN